MEEGDALVAVAEISLGLAGFAGVVAALHIRERWHPLDAWRTLSLLAAGFGAVLLSLSPFALHSFGIGEDASWRLCSAAMAAYSVGGVWLGNRYQPDPGTVPHYVLLSVFFVSLVVINVIVQGANALGFFADAAFGAFFVGLLLHLVYGVVQFGVIIFLRPPP